MPTIGQTNQVFAPTQVAGCQLWLDAADTTTLSLTGNNLTQWRDKSGNNRNLSGSGPLYETYNGYPNVNVNGARGFAWSGSVNLQSVTIYIVISQQNRNNDVAFFQAGNDSNDINGFTLFADNNTGIPLGTVVATTRIYSNGDYGNLLSGSFPKSTASDLIPLTLYEVTISSQNAVSLFMNGSLNNQNSFNTTRGTNLTTFRIGGIFWSYFGRIYEVLLYNSVLVTSQRQQVEGYLAWKWGLIANLPDGHPFKQSPIAPFAFRSTPFRGSLNIWTPARISGLSVWLDAMDTSTVTLNGSRVTQWSDKSGNNRNLSQGTLANAPNYTSVNSRQMIDFVRANKTFLLNASISQIYTNFTLYLIIQRKNIPTDSERFFVAVPVAYATDWNTTTGFSFNTPIELASNGSGTVSPDNTNLNITMYSIATQNNGANVFKNGSRTVLINRNMGLNGNSIGILLGSGTNGGINTLSEQFNGYMGEVVLFFSTLTVSQQQQVEGYLAWKWGLQGNLPSNHPFKLFPPPP
jgi:hypothetical protein